MKKTKNPFVTFNGTNNRYPLTTIVETIQLLEEDLSLSPKTLNSLFDKFANQLRKEHKSVIGDDAKTRKFIGAIEKGIETNTGEDIDSYEEARAHVSKILDLINNEEIHTTLKSLIFAFGQFEADQKIDFLKYKSIKAIDEEMPSLDEE